MDAISSTLAVLDGDFLLSRACITLASLKNTEVVSLIATVVEHLVTRETMQMSASKTYYKTASLISNNCKSIALFTGQTAEGLAFQLIDDVLDFTGTSSSLGKGVLSDIRRVINSFLWHILLYIPLGGNWLYPPHENWLFHHHLGKRLKLLNRRESIIIELDVFFPYIDYDICADCFFF
ncbi:hypothetical protein L6452_26767 [Arctium lappa]|uniref:Uncharacterized protein n=1 Tax=Arctium lappa TaxID=4217 RepID=A0ACB8ZUR9_ARCLA|nr:hypothetical protein L6452_26767 [Arctium lappa]